MGNLKSVMLADRQISRFSFFIFTASAIPTRSKGRKQRGVESGVGAPFRDRPDQRSADILEVDNNRKN